jgi:hypothetical protein
LIRFNNASGDLSMEFEGFAPSNWVTLLESMIAIGVFHDADEFDALVMGLCGSAAGSVLRFSSPVFTTEELITENTLRHLGVTQA